MREGLPPEQRRWAVVATGIGTLMSMVDQTIANTALPTIANDLHASAASSIWVINAYQVASTVCLIPVSALADIVGYARLYRIGLIVFITASLACALSHSLLALSIARMVQGLGAGVITITTGPINRITFPSSMLGRATGYTAMVVALGAAAGPVLSGVILAVSAWPWLFAINVPIGLVSLWLTWRSIPLVPGRGGRFDGLSAALSAATFGLGIVAFDQLGHHASSLSVSLEFAATVVIGAAFLRRQCSLPMPMFAVDLFKRSRELTLAIAACCTSFVAQTIAYVALPFGFQTVMGRTPLEIGMMMLPWLLAAAAMAPLAGRLADRYGTAVLSAAGLGTFTVGLALLALEPVHASMLDVMWRMLIAGIGYGIFQSPNNRAIQGSAPRERAASAQGLQATARLSGQTIGATIVAFIFGFAAGPHPSNGTDAASVTTSMLVAVGFALVSVLASVVRTTASRSREATARAA
jgi:DHA2 family multidrug resistance protein-like MFS transporter